MNAQIAIPQEGVTDFCRRWQIVELALFGSVLGDDFRPDSDVDVLVSFHPEARHTLFDMVQMQEELERLFGRKVDLVSRRGIEASRNYLRRRAILESAEVLYES
ncbi:MAG: nucleotidyltransferase family protein [Coprothermobacterota bacterium]|nr:nucleotidyltransferase family protein [Coprothermobacterota bacterium]